jgi:hypothetical protein
MLAYSVWNGIFFALIILSGAARTLYGEEVTIPFNVEKLLSEPERKSFPWQITISEPQRTLERRYFVKVSTLIPHSSLVTRIARRDLY